jgi:hypothetical protein
VSKSGVQDMQKYGEKTIGYWDSLWMIFFVYLLSADQ